MTVAVVSVLMTLSVFMAVLMIFLCAMLMLMRMRVLIRMGMRVLMRMGVCTDIAIFVRYNMHFYSLLSL
ncbi:hypothetical protein BRYFOR_06363 [Marvinbryantia formatexigens DSM 14469]|uniref:Uncharacterized protein n=1 Tax=Marvinbryantia formatexigens DSM 14469 TaxID=478749 RepID=C6LCL6_9FIRM|nr:hypothetical protein BRYFOR_06363 [Marvinbryantia formatexigens DSM 14469]